MLGIPHPPGNPFFVLLAHVFSILPIGNSSRMRINILAALCSAVVGGHLVPRGGARARGVAARALAARTGAAAAALLGATAFTVWNQSVVNEKVYTVSLAFFAIVSWLTVLWCDDPEGRTPTGCSC